MDSASAEPGLDDSGCVQDSSESYKGQAELLDLSDDVLLYILKLCTPRDLKALGHTCHRLGVLICDRTLWQRVDARSQPVGEERLRWYLTHCLNTATQELKLTGYVNRDTRCLGIQDLICPDGNDPGPFPGDSGHMLLRMWYPHLPRYAMSPRWPDKREAAGKAYSTGSEDGKPPLVPLSQLASVIFAGNSTPNPTNAGPSLNNSDPNSNNAGPNSGLDNSNNPDGNANNTGEDYNDLNISKDSLDDVTRCHGPQFTLNHVIMKALRTKCRNLTSLFLEYCNLDYKNANLRYFPSRLKKLSLKGTRCYNLPISTSYLGKIQIRLPELEYLDISECEWFEPASLMPLSKLKNLQELHMRDCRRLTECVAYTSLATRYGFKSLRVLDVRASPVADSEVSAFGWLPLLEELYVTAQVDFRNSMQHAHKWDDVKAPFSELEPWEREEPDCYKCKSPLLECVEDEEDLIDDEGVSQGRLCDVMLGNYVTERRVIVIAPNRPNHNRNNDQPHRPLFNINPAGLDLRPSLEPRQDAASNNETAHRNLKRPHPCQDCKLPKKKQEMAHSSKDDEAFSDNSLEDRSEPMNLESTASGSCTSGLNNSKLTASGSDSSQPSASLPEIFKPSSSRSGRSQPSVSKLDSPQLSITQSGSSQSSMLQSDNSEPSSSKSDNSQPSESDFAPIEPLSSHFKSIGGAGSSKALSSPKLRNQTSWLEVARKLNLKRQGDQSEDQNSSAAKYSNVGNAKSNAKSAANIARPGANNARIVVNQARPVANQARPVANQSRPVAEQPRHIDDRPNIVGPRLHIDDRPNIVGRPLDAFILDYPDGRVQGLAQLARIDIDFQRGHVPRDFPPLGYQLVSDSAVVRFGRADNNNINYINIGHQYNANDPGMRPDRSNLRVLSITGYRNITDRSLEHLATAAPHLRRIDFSMSSVTQAGVEVFKAIRPNCEVIFSSFESNL